MRASFAYFTGIVCAGLLFILSDSNFEPARELLLIQGSGQIGLGFLFATLFVSPIIKLLPDALDAKNVASLRRALGLCATGFSILHFALIFRFDFVTEFTALLTEPQWRNGFTALTVLVILSVSSFPVFIKYLRIREWKSLHQLSYAALFFVLLHVTVSPSASWTELRVIGVVAFTVISVRLLSHQYHRRKER